MLLFFLNLFLNKFGSEKTKSVQHSPGLPYYKFCLIREYNSALPSSAACERVFSTAGLIFTAKRTRLSDLNFEILVFFKLNGECCRCWIDSPTKTSNK
jgi:hypothetical protein